MKKPPQFVIWISSLLCGILVAFSASKYLPIGIGLFTFLILNGIDRVLQRIDVLLESEIRKLKEIIEKHEPS